MMSAPVLPFSVELEMLAISMLSNQVYCASFPQLVAWSMVFHQKGSAFLASLVILTYEVEAGCFSPDRVSMAIHGVQPDGPMHAGVQ